MARPSSSRGKSPRPPVQKQAAPITVPVTASSIAAPKTKSKAKKSTSYKSEGVDDNDVFLLPGSDYIVALGITIVATVVRLFKIYQPSSVVFDEVQ